MSETKIKGLKIYYDDDYIKIINSYKINNKEKMKEIINEIYSKNMFLRIKRPMNSLTRQWATRNRFYRMRLFRKKTKDLFLKEKQSSIAKYTCFILGFEQKKRLKKLFRKIKRLLRKEK